MLYIKISNCIIMRKSKINYNIEKYSADEFLCIYMLPMLISIFL